MNVFKNLFKKNNTENKSDLKEITTDFSNNIVILNLEKWLKNIENEKKLKFTNDKFIEDINNIIASKHLDESNINILIEKVQNAIDRANDKNKIILKNREIEKNILDITVIINLLNDFSELKEIEVSSDYETFLESEGYVLIKKIQKIFDKIYSSGTKDYLYTSLEDIISLYENKLNVFFQKLSPFEIDIENTLKNTQQLSSEIIQFTSSLNKAKSQGQLSRLQAALVKRKDVLVTKENELNISVGSINTELLELIKEFEEVSSFISLYLEEKTLNMKNNLTTQEKNIINTEELKYNVEMLKNLLYILKNERNENKYGNNDNLS